MHYVIVERFEREMHQRCPGSIKKIKTPFGSVWWGTMVFLPVVGVLLTWKYAVRPARIDRL